MAMIWLLIALSYVLLYAFAAESDAFHLQPQCQFALTSQVGLPVSGTLHLHNEALAWLNVQEYGRDEEVL